MLRFFALVSLVVLNICVWLGPAEHVSGKLLKQWEPEHDLATAQSLANAGQINAALESYQLLVVREPENAAIHYNFGLFCAVHADALKTLGWSNAQVASKMRDHMYRARELKPDDSSIAQDYARTLMDQAFFDPAETQRELNEAWHYVIHQANARYEKEPDWTFHAHTTACALMHLARVALRCGDEHAASAYVSEARSALPTVRVPDVFLASEALTSHSV